MDPVRPEFVPDASLSTAEMQAQQREIAESAVFDDAFDRPPLPSASASASASTSASAVKPAVTSEAPPVVAGVDQAFGDGTATSAIVVLQDGEVVERVHATEPTEIPYIPGLLAFREGGPILAAFERLETEPDVVLVDGSGRIHYRQAGLATHIGVALDLPAVGVAKRLLCGTPEESLADPLPVGTRVPIAADDEVDAPDGTVIGYALQTRQFDGPDRYINPLFVSPGHRVGAETAADVVIEYASGYKLPEPIRLADAYVGELTA